MQAYDVMRSVRVNNQVKEGLQEWSGGRQEVGRKSKKLQMTRVSVNKAKDARNMERETSCRVHGFLKVT